MCLCNFCAGSAGRAFDGGSFTRPSGWSFGRECDSLLLPRLVVLKVRSVVTRRQEKARRSQPRATDCATFLLGSHPADYSTASPS